MFTSSFLTTQATIWIQVDSPAPLVGLLWGLRPDRLLGVVLGLYSSYRGSWGRPKLWPTLGAGLVSITCLLSPPPATLANHPKS